MTGELLNGCLGVVRGDQQLPDEDALKSRRSEARHVCGPRIPDSATATTPSGIIGGKPNGQIGVHLERAQVTLVDTH